MKKRNQYEIVIPVQTTIGKRIVIEAYDIETALETAKLADSSEFSDVECSGGEEWLWEELSLETTLHG